MAASLSRPDPSSPASVAEARFSNSRRGFSQDEVRAFLTSVAAELGRLQERERQLEAQLAAAEVDIAPQPELDEATVAAMVGEETLHVLHTARESASQIKIRAEESAAKILRDANDEVNRVRQDAEVEAARKRHDATSDAEAEVALAKQQGREMVNEARAYRERVLADLERRTNVARQQIEDLVHGRDRLLQVFERARLVAVDVTSELQSIDAPDEFVNLSPTTGPLPLMVPATKRPSESARATVLGDEEEAIDDGTGEYADAATATEGDEVETTVESDEAESSDEAETAEEIDADESAVLAADEPAPKPPRDANVVSLFRDRGPDDETAELHDEEAAVDEEEGEDDAATVDDTAADDTDPHDVGGIFERLRNETPGAEPNVAADGADVEPDAAEAEPEPASEVEVEATPFTRRDEAIVPLIVSGARKLKRVLADEQNGVLDLLRQNRPVTQIDELIPEIDEHAQAYVAALDDDLVDAAVAGAAEVHKNDTKTLRTTIRKGALEPAHAILRDDLVVPLRARLERAIIDGGGDNEEITKRVRAVYREWKTQHIDHQLDDAFRFAYGGGLAAGVKPGTTLRWLIDSSEPTCADCEDNSLAGDVESGGEYPTGHTSAPAHAGCRCLTVPTAQ